MSLGAPYVKLVVLDLSENLVDELEVRASVYSPFLSLDFTPRKQLFIFESCWLKNLRWWQPGTRS